MPQASFDAAPCGPEMPTQAPKKPRTGRWTDWAKKAGAHATGVTPTQPMPAHQRMACDTVLESAGFGLAVFSWFAGIGVSDLTLKALGLKPQWSVAWEADPSCQKVLRRNRPDKELREDVLAISAASLAGELREKDINQVLVTAGPLCPYFSRIKADPTGRGGTEGRKFDASVDILHELGKKIRGRSRSCSRTWWPRMSTSCHTSMTGAE